MRKPLLAAAAAFLLGLSGAALAGYADDRAEIENLSNRYMIAVDAGDIETVMSTWAEDGVLDWVGGVENGKAAIRKAMSNFGGGRPVTIPEGATSRPRTHHQIINHVIDVNGNTAKTTCLLVRDDEQHAAEGCAAPVLRALRRRARQGERQVAVQEAQGL